MNLFQRGNFTLSSGAISPFKIECDALTKEDCIVGWVDNNQPDNEWYSPEVMSFILRNGFFGARIVNPRHGKFIGSLFIYKGDPSLPPDYSFQSTNLYLVDSSTIENIEKIIIDVAIGRVERADG